MSISKTLLFVLLALFSHTVFAHTYLSAVFLNNNRLDEGDCVRPHPRTEWDFPILSVTNEHMRCGWLPSADKPANKKCPIAAGSTMGLQWWHAHPNDDVIEATHKGPVIIYLAKSDSGAGDVWFKIYEDGLVNGQWGVDRLIANRGRVDFTIPADIAPGNYLLRGEVIALHSAYAVDGAQPYVGCVELTISGSGKATPAGVSFPGNYKNTDPGMLFSIYQGIRTYVIPGPAVYKAGSEPSTPTVTPTATPTSPAENTPVYPTYPAVYPTYPPAATAAPVYPTYPPSNGANTLKVGVNNVNEWWAGITVSGGGETTVKIEVKDSRAGSTYAAMVDQGYAYSHTFSSVITLPLSIRVTSSSGKQIELVNFVKAKGAAAMVDTWMSYSSYAPSTSAPTAAPATAAPATAAPATAAPATAAPATAAPTAAATVAPTNDPSTNAPSTGKKVKVQLLDGSNAWWFAVLVSGVDASKVKSVEFKDSNKYKTTFTALQANSWGPYTFSSQGSPAVAKYWVRVTMTDGSSSTIELASFASGTEAEGKF